MDARSFNCDIGNWDVRSLEVAESMFNGAFAFNCGGGDLNRWNTSSLVDMSFMFCRAGVFNCNISSWSLENTLFTRYMFCEAASFDGNITAWNPEKVIDMNAMFHRATSFRQDIRGWNILSVTSMEETFSVCPVNYTEEWKEQQRRQRERDDRWTRRKHWMMVISPFLRQDGITESPVQVVFDIQGIYQLITSFL